MFEDKFTLPMTLAGALRDDLIALEAGMCVVLPDSDLSGRQLIYLEPRRHTREGYSSDSMMRAIWYVFECAVEKNTDIGGGMIQISWVKNSTIWDYDLKVCFAHLTAQNDSSCTSSLTSLPVTCFI